ncbi:hypothetical protein [Spirillospora sp. CA-294931]|uniref:hypothetical protein n=1 Tax=Spirillospora sp. CA-294931 TaxID=3240042 RepID=UPI003D90FAB2
MTFGVGTAQAAPRAAICGEVDGSVDFNADGCPDLVVGDPNATVAGKARAGRINVVFGGEGGKVTPLVQGHAGVGDTPEADDGFGTVVRALRVNSDNYTDLVVGVPSESVGSADNAGVVHVIYGSADGLGGGRAGKVLRRGAEGVPGSPMAGDQFGAALGVDRTLRTDGTPGDRPAPGLAVGAPGVDVNGAADAGAAGVVAFDGTAGDVAQAAMITQDSPGISGGPEAGDRFGAAVDLYGGGVSDEVRGYNLAVGVPGEDLGTVKDAGMVHQASGLNSDVPLTQDVAGVDGVAEAGDQFGAAVSYSAYHVNDGPSVAWLAVGVPTEDIGSAADAGAVHLFGGEDDYPLPHLRSVNQNTPGIVGASEAGDRFGAVLALDTGRGANERASLVVGMPSEDVGSLADAGAVHVLNPETPDKNNQIYTQEKGKGTPQAGDRFGAALTVRLDRMMIGAPDDVTYDKGATHDISTDGQAGGFGLLAPGSRGIPVDGAVRFGASIA